MKKINLELRQAMNGCEVMSLTYEDVVGVRNDYVIRDGKVVDILDTDEKVVALWAEMTAQDGINEEMEELRREFLAEIK